MRERKLLEERLAAEEREKQRLADRLKEEQQKEKEEVNAMTTNSCTNNVVCSV